MTASAARLAAALADRYRIERELGQGGMATVYLAEDVKHDRKVALKVLRPELAAVLGAERFVVEIKTTAQLQHPHILPLFDSGTADGFLYYVMPFIEGETLRDKLTRETQLGIEEAVRITTEVADALDYAHRNGVIHRDIKPENILLHDGRPMVADFGIALAVSAAAGGRMTETGMSLGTPHYMSPEQATAEKDLTNRSDIYSLGSVLYEMLTGNPPHVGASAQQIIMKIVTEEAAPVTQVRKAVPANVAAAVAQALEKLPADRFASARAFADALVTASFTRSGGAVPTTAGRADTRWIRRFYAASGMALILAVGWAASVALHRSGTEAAVRRLRLVPPRPLEDLRVAALSLDGSKILLILRDSAAAADGSRPLRIWIRSLDQLDPAPVPGSEGAYAAAFSPDGRQVAFMADGGDLKVVTLDAGSAPVTRLADIGFRQLTWGSDGFLYGAYNWTSLPTLWRVRESGGAPDSIGVPTPGYVHTDPYALPGGRGVLFALNSNSLDPIDDSIAVLDLSSGQQRVLLQGRFPSYAPAGFLAFLNAAGQLMAAPFDLDDLRVTGPPSVIIENVAAFSLSNTGDLLYVAGRRASQRPEVAWVNRDGTSEAVDWPMDFGPLSQDPALSPDGTRLALAVGRDTEHVLIKDLVRGPVTTLLGDGAEGSPAWSADGREIGVASLRGDGRLRLWRRRADGSGDPVAITGPLALDSVDVGRWSLDQPIVMGTPTGLSVFQPGTDSVPTPILTAGVTHSNPTLSPDGHWVAFEALVGEEQRILARPFPNVDSALIPVSLGWAEDPRWSRDGRTLYYIAKFPEGRDVVAAHLRTTPTLEVVTHERVAPYQRGYSWETGGWMYDVAPAGNRLLIVGWRQEPTVRTSLVLVQNFVEEIRRKVDRDQ